MSHRILLLAKIIIGLLIIAYVVKSGNVLEQGTIHTDSWKPPLQQIKEKLDIQQPVVGTPIWQGNSAGYKIVWTMSDLYIRDDNSINGIWRPLVQSGFNSFVANMKEGFETKEGESTKDKPQSLNCEYNRSFQVLSVVGSLVSFVDYYSLICGHASGSAPPSLDTRFTTIDLGKQGDVLYNLAGDTSDRDIDLVKPGKIVKLSDYFKEQELLNALLNDRIIKKALSDLERPSFPRTLSELRELFADRDYELGDTGYELRPDFLTRFVFHHIDGSKVAVRIGLPPNNGAKKAFHLQLGVLLEIPPALRKSFELAETRKEGFMMKDIAVIADKQMTEFSFKKDFR
jgi:hypothetical protein